MREEGPSRVHGTEDIRVELSKPLIMAVTTRDETLVYKKTPLQRAKGSPGLFSHTKLHVASIVEQDIYPTIHRESLVGLAVEFLLRGSNIQLHGLSAEVFQMSNALLIARSCDHLVTASQGDFDELGAKAGGGSSNDPDLRRHAGDPDMDSVGSRDTDLFYALDQATAGPYLYHTPAHVESSQRMLSA